MGRDSKLNNLITLNAKFSTACGCLLNMSIDVNKIVSEIQIITLSVIWTTPWWLFQFTTHPQNTHAAMAVTSNALNLIIYFWFTTFLFHVSIIRFTMFDEQ